MQATCSSETSSTFLSMEKTRRKSSASEFFSRRHSSSLFQSMRRYSSSTLFSGAGAGSSSWRSAGGRRHSSSQLVPSPAHQLQGDTARPALGDVAELQETGRQIHTGGAAEGSLACVGTKLSEVRDQKRRIWSLGIISFRLLNTNVEVA